MELCANSIYWAAFDIGQFIVKETQHFFLSRLTWKFHFKHMKFKFRWFPLFSNHGGRFFVRKTKTLLDSCHPYLHGGIFDIKHGVFDLRLQYAWIFLLVSLEIYLDYTYFKSCWCKFHCHKNFSFYSKFWFIWDLF